MLDEVAVEIVVRLENQAILMKLKLVLRRASFWPFTAS